MTRAINSSLIAIIISLTSIFNLYAFDQTAPNFKAIDASTLTIINKAMDNGDSLQRIDESRYEMPEKSRNGMRHSTGLAILFTTNSRNINAEWETAHNYSGKNMTPIFHSGLDLYIRDGKEWIYAGSARPSLTGKLHASTIVNNMAEGEKECMLYLPMFNELSSLKLYIDKEATIAPLTSPFKHKIIFVGSSLTHGASASRPGAAYVARLGRMFNAETPNIGLSGRCKLDNYFADIVCDSEADAFIFDTFSNSTKTQIEERLYNFVKRITEVHPDKPMIFLQTIKRDAGYFNLKGAQYNNEQRAEAEAQMRKMCREFKHVYFINPGIYAGDDHEGTIDGTHLNDLGVQRTLDVIAPKIEKILRKYGVK